MQVVQFIVANTEQSHSADLAGMPVTGGGCDPFTGGGGGSSGGAGGPARPAVRVRLGQG